MSHALPKTMAPPAGAKRRWLRITLISLGSLVLVLILTAVALGLYSRSLWNRYTQTQPQVFEKVEDAKGAMERLKAKFAEFQQDLNTSKGTVKPFEISADELNAALATTKGIGDHMRVAVQGDRLQAKFSFPIGDPRAPQGSRRYLNGEAAFKVKLENGFLKLSIASAQANQQPLPRWALSMLERRVQTWNKQYQTLEFFQKLESISVQEGAVVLIPYNGP